MRAIPSSMDPGIVAAVDSRLRPVESDEQVRIPWAIENGSRAWGFPSPHSDYDCRFIYIRPTSAYLSLWPERDVVETPLDSMFDVNGWDLGKTIRLIAHGNATAGEWLRSPIVYDGDAAFRDRLLAFADETVERAAIGRHYSHVAQQQMTGPRNLKRFFYILRPAATQLVAVKAETRDMGSGRVPDVLRDFAADQVERAAIYEHAPLEQDPADVQARADALFAELVA